MYRQGRRVRHEGLVLNFLYYLFVLSRCLFTHRVVEDGIRQ